MIGTNTKAIIDGREQSVIATKRFTDEDTKELVEYLLEKDSIVSRLVLTEGTLTKEGIQFIVDKYGHKLEELDLSDNELTDEDVEPLLQLKANNVFKALSLNNNLLSETVIQSLKNQGFFVEADHQETVLALTHAFAPQHQFKESIDHPELSLGKRKVAELLKDPKYEEFLKTANVEDLKVFFEDLKEACVKYQKKAKTLPKF